MTRQSNRLNKLILSACIGAATLMYAPFALAADAGAPDTPASAPADSPATPMAGVNGMITKTSGLQYRDLKPGSGTTAQSGNSVSVHYTGWLQNSDGSRGRKFDSSLDRGEPLVFLLGAGNVIKGWDEGVQGMQIGGKRRLVIPSILGYGAKGAGNGLIPANATLIFEVELIKVQ